MSDQNVNQLARLQIRSDKLSEIEEKQHAVRALKEEWQRKKDGALRAKKAYDEENEELHQLIEQAEDRQPRLPGLSADELARMNGQGFVATAVAPAITPKQPEAWRSVPVAEALDVTLKVLDILEEADIRTMGEFVDADAAGSIRELKGIGDKTYDKLKDQMIEWISRNQVTEETEETEADYRLPTRIFVLESERDVDVLRWVGGRPMVQLRDGAPEVVLSPEDWRELSDEDFEDSEQDQTVYGEVPDDEGTMDEGSEEFEDEAVMVAADEDEEDEDDEDPL